RVGCGGPRFRPRLPPNGVASRHERHSLATSRRRTACSAADLSAAVAAGSASPCARRLVFCSLVLIIVAARPIRQEEMPRIGVGCGIFQGMVFIFPEACNN